MNITRRNLAALLPLLATTAKAAESPAPSKCFKFDDLPVKQNGGNVSRAIFHGVTHSQFPFEAHETEIAAGSAPHPPHHHVHEELVVVLEGSIDFTVNGQTTKLGPGSVGYAASNDEHGMKNTSDSRTRYFVIALGREA